ncbi:MAG: hypothetical protein WC479_07305 [Candidatus Izemoplasmatales bacterium]
MTYSKIIHPEQTQELQGIFSELEKLTPGAQLKLEGLKGDLIGRVRYALYNWLHQMGIKRLFRIRTEIAFGRISILRLGLPSDLRLTVERPQAGLGALLEELVKTDEAEVDEQIITWIKQGKISIEEAGQLSALYHEAMA